MYKIFCMILYDFIYLQKYKLICSTHSVAPWKYEDFLIIFTYFNLFFIYYIKEYDLKPPYIYSTFYLFIYF